MAFDSNSILKTADNTAASKLLPNNDEHALRIHEDAYKGLKGGNQASESQMLDYFKRPQDILKGGSGEGKVIIQLEPPSDKDRDKAETKIEKGISKLISEADRATITAMTSAITHGDAKAFGEAVKKAGGDPEKLRTLVEEVDKLLTAQGSSTKLDVTADGKVLISDPTSSTGLAFNPATGKAEGKQVEHNLDGSMTVKPGEVLHVDLVAIFKSIGDSTVDSINNGGAFKLPTIIGLGEEPGKEPFKPWGGPFKPWDEPLKPWRDPRFDPSYDPFVDGHKPNPQRHPNLSDLTLDMDLPGWYKQR